MKKLFQRKLSTRIILSFVLNTFFITLILSVISYAATYQLTVINLGNRAAEIASITSVSINVDEFNSYKTKDDANKKSYKEVTDKLSYIRKISGAKYLYAMRKNEEGKFVYVIDASEKPSAIGDVEDNTYTGYTNVYSGQAYTSRKFDIDEYGITISAYSPIKDSAGKVVGFIGVDYDAERDYSILMNIERISIVISIVIILLFSLVGMLLSRSISKPILNIADFAERISNHNLQVEKINIKNKDEIGILANTFNIMVENFRSLINDTQRTLGLVTETSNNLTSMAESADLSVTQVTKAIESIATASTQQTKVVELGNEKTNVLADSVEDISRAISNVTKDIEEINKLNRNGIETINLSIQKSKEHSSARNAAGQVLLEVERSSEEIGSIIDTINQIAGQTNLLALNASIESARAGEVGRGFAVVAEEIRKLAEQSANATKNIAALINNIQVKSQNAVKSMEIAEIIGSEQDKVTHDTEEVFSILSKKIQTLSEYIIKIRTQNEDMNNKKDVIVNVMENILQLAEENSSSIEETTASTEEILALVHKLTNHAKALNSSFDEVQNNIQKFKI